MPLQAEVRHHRRDDAGLREASLVAPALRDDGHHLVAVDHMALFIDDDHPVGVAVERDPHIRPHFAHLARQRLGRGRPDLEIDVEPVRLDADLDHFGAELPQRLGRDFVGGAVGAIDDDAHSVERDLAAERPLGVFDIAGLDVVDALGAAQIRRAGEHRRDVAVHQRLDPRLDLVGEFEAVRPEQLDAVILVGVVGGGNHHPEIAAHRAGQHRDRRRRDRAQQQHVDADRREARDQRVFDHVAGEPRVFADDHALAMFAPLEGEAGRLANLQRHIRRDLAVGPAPNAVGAEIFARHDRTFPEAKPRRIETSPSYRIFDEQSVTIRFRLLTLRGGVAEAGLGA